MQRSFHQGVPKHVRNDQSVLINDNKENFQEMHPVQNLMPLVQRPKPSLKEGESERQSYKDLLKSFQTKN